MISDAYVKYRDTWGVAILFPLSVVLSALLGFTTSELKCLFCHVNVVFFIQSTSEDIRIRFKVSYSGYKQKLCSFLCVKKLLCHADQGAQRRPTIKTTGRWCSLLYLILRVVHISIITLKVSGYIDVHGFFFNKEKTYNVICFVRCLLSTEE